METGIVSSELHLSPDLNSQMHSNYYISHHLSCLRISKYLNNTDTVLTEHDLLLVLKIAIANVLLTILAIAAISSERLIQLLLSVY